MKLTADTSHGIIVSRTDKIGDVVLTLPLVGLIRQQYPDARIVFLGRSYTAPVLQCCSHIDEIWDWDKIRLENPTQTSDRLKGIDCILHVFPQKEIAQWAQRAGIPKRIGTMSRLFHWTSCTQRILLRRKSSPLHESQLNIMLARRWLALEDAPSLEQIKTLYGLTPRSELPTTIEPLLTRHGFHLALHPLSFGSAREWPLSHYVTLIESLSDEPVHIYLTGGPREQQSIQKTFAHLLDSRQSVTILAGKLSLPEMISFIGRCNGLVAASTGPLHIAAALGIHALGLYPPIRPMHPGRWGPIGKRAQAVVARPHCNSCRKMPQNCLCMSAISPETVHETISQWLNRSC